MIKIGSDGDIYFDAPRGAAKELGARWSPAGCWKLAGTVMNAKAIVDALPDLADLSVALMPSRREILGRPDLYKYQREAAGRLVDSKHGQMLCLSPGLGKTAVAVAAADELAADTLVVAPASLQENWLREIKRWSDGRAAFRVTTWDKFARSASDQRADVLVLDESVMAKNRRALRYKRISKARKNFGLVWLLSGSPTTRYADDLWTQLNLIWPRAFPSYWRFAERYAFVEETPWGRKVSGTRESRDAAADNADLVLVVNQEDVIDLPEYLFDAIDVTLTPKQRKAYDSMSDDFIADLSGSDVVAANEIARLGKLQQIASFWDGESAKHQALVDSLALYETPMLVWTHWRDGGNALAGRLHAAGLTVGHVTGETRDRDAVIEMFKRGGLDALVLSIGVGKFGHTLTNAKTIVYVDKTWNADDYFQSLHRVRRIGLKHRPVVVTLRAPGTVDELVEENLESKLGGISKLTKARLADLLMGLGR